MKYEQYSIELAEKKNSLYVCFHFYYKILIFIYIICCIDIVILSECKLLYIIYYFILFKFCTRTFLFVLIMIKYLKLFKNVFNIIWEHRGAVYL